jgi:hypothetical protein
MINHFALRGKSAFIECLLDNRQLRSPIVESHEDGIVPRYGDFDHPVYFSEDRTYPRSISSGRTSGDRQLHGFFCRQGGLVQRQCAAYKRQEKA